VRCPYCSKDETNVLDSRPAGDAIRRRRECIACKKRFTTYERVGLVDLVIVKRDGRREPFSKDKLVRGLLRACEKRPVKHERIEDVAREIELALRREEKREVPSKRIGELVMEKLKTLDAVAYVRFASVYRHFKTAEQFAEEIEKLKKEEKKGKRKA